MSVVVVTPPEAALVDLDLTKAHLRVDHDEDDALITSYIEAACGHLNGPGGWLNRSISPQTLELRRDGFWCPLRLPYGPVTAIVSVVYVDGSGTEQTLDDAGYVLNDEALSLAYGASWPSVRGDRNGVRIRYEAGDATLHPSVRSAILLMVGDLYSNRESSVQGLTSAGIAMSTTVENLLAPFRIWS